MLNRVCDSKEKKKGRNDWFTTTGAASIISSRLLFVSQPDPDYIPEGLSWFARDL